MVTLELGPYSSSNGVEQLCEGCSQNLVRSHWPFVEIEETLHMSHLLSHLQSAYQQALKIAKSWRGVGICISFLEQDLHLVIINN